MSLALKIKMKLYIHIYLRKLCKVDKAGEQLSKYHFYFRALKGKQNKNIGQTSPMTHLSFCTSLLHRQSP